MTYFPVYHYKVRKEVFRYTLAVSSEQHKLVLHIACRVAKFEEHFTELTEDIFDKTFPHFKCSKLCRHEQKQTLHSFLKQAKWSWHPTCERKATKTQQNLQPKELTFGKVITTWTYNESQITLIYSNGSSTYNIPHKRLPLKIK